MGRTTRGYVPGGWEGGGECLGVLLQLQDDPNVHWVNARNAHLVHIDVDAVAYIGNSFGDRVCIDGFWYGRPVCLFFCVF